MKKWYIAQTFSKFENKVVGDLTSRKNSMNLQDKIFRILAPEEEYVEIKHDKRAKKDVEVTKKRKIYPGYIFIEIEVDKEIDDETWYIIRNTPGVTGLLGSSGGGTKPIPVSTREMNNILAREGLIVLPKTPFEVGDVVKVNGSSALEGQIGTVSKVNAEKEEVVILIEFFGRQTPSTFNFNQVKKVK